MCTAVCRHCFLAGTLAAVLVFCAAQPAAASRPDAAVSPALFQRMLQLAGLDAALQPGPDEDFPALVTVQTAGCGSFALGFPAAGLQRRAPFYLAIDDAAALVELTEAGTPVVIDGDERVVASGILGFIACLLTTIAMMVVEIVTAALTLNILGILTAVFEGVIGIVTCVLQILV